MNEYSWDWGGLPLTEADCKHWVIQEVVNAAACTARPIVNNYGEVVAGFRLIVVDDYGNLLSEAV